MDYSYDEKSDVMYISFGKPVIRKEVEHKNIEYEGMVIRTGGKIINGITIVDYSKKTKDTVIKVSKEKEPDFDKAIDINAYLRNKFGVCGCSEMDLVILEVRRILEWADSDMAKRETYDKIYINQGLFYIIAGLLDKEGFINHGCAIRCPWITDKGKQLLKSLCTFTFEEIDEATGEAYDGCHYTE